MDEERKATLNVPLGTAGRALTYSIPAQGRCGYRRSLEFSGGHGIPTPRWHPRRGQSGDDQALRIHARNL